MKSYNPLEKRNLAESVVNELLEKPVIKMDSIEQVEGAGVYAIYYTGDFPYYSEVKELNEFNKFNQPIYVGKAVPAGGRMGGFELESLPGFVLYGRLKEHYDSVRLAENLNENDFHCRFLTVDDIWIPLSESLLITSFRPIWNVSITGFGNHDPGAGRYQQKRSYWDTVHPGRPWAMRCQPSVKTSQEILANLNKKPLTSDTVES